MYYLSDGVLYRDRQEVKVDAYLVYICDIVDDCCAIDIDGNVWYIGKFGTRKFDELSDIVYIHYDRECECTIAVTNSGVELCCGMIGGDIEEATVMDAPYKAKKSFILIALDQDHKLYDGEFERIPGILAKDVYSYGSHSFVVDLDDNLWIINGSYGPSQTNLTNVAVLGEGVVCLANGNILIYKEFQFYSILNMPDVEFLVYNSRESALYVLQQDGTLSRIVLTNQIVISNEVYAQGVTSISGQVKKWTNTKSAK